MAAQKLTATKIDKHRPIRNDERLADGNGLYVRFRRNRFDTVSKTWMYTFKQGTKSVYLTLGDHDGSLSDFDLALYKLAPNAKLTLDTARRIAAEITDWRKRGMNPTDFITAESSRQAVELQVRDLAQARFRSQADEESLTVQDMFDSWLTDGVRRKDGNAELRRSFSADVLPKIGAIPIKKLTEHDLRALLRTMVDRGVNRAAVMVRNSLTQMFAWAEKRQPWRKLLVDGDPMDLIEIEKIVSPEYDLDNKRERMLSTDEIQELMAIFDRMRVAYDEAPDKRATTQPISQTTQRAIWIMLSTMCRVGEMSMSKWEHINFEAGEWFIPRENVKDNLADLTVYLSSFALHEFRQLQRITGFSKWCFPARNNDQHMNVKSISKQVGDRQSMFKKGKDGGPRKPMKNRRHDNTLVLGGGKNGAWTPHDLRRTAATLMQSLGVSLEIIDRCQNHVLPGSKVRRHYLLHDYAAEKRNAWDLLGDRLASIVSFPSAKSTMADAWANAAAQRRLSSRK